jgi:hypothetical protein
LLMVLWPQNGLCLPKRYWILDTGCLMLDKDTNWILTFSIQYQASSSCFARRAIGS